MFHWRAHHTLDFQSPSIVRIFAHNSSQQMLVSAVGTRAAAREKERYSCTRVLPTSLPRVCTWEKHQGKGIRKSDSTETGLQVFKILTSTADKHTCGKSVSKRCFTGNIRAKYRVLKSCSRASPWLTSFV